VDISGFPILKKEAGYYFQYVFNAKVTELLISKSGY